MYLGYHTPRIIKQRQYIFLKILYKVIPALFIRNIISRNLGAYFCLTVYPAADKPVIQHKIISIAILEIIIKQHIQKINLADSSIFTYIAAHDTHNRTKIKTLHKFKTPFSIFSQSAVSSCSMWICLLFFRLKMVFQYHGSWYC